MSSYLKIIQKCWENVTNSSSSYVTTDTSWFFKKSDIEQAALDLSLSVKNVADIRYRFDSRDPLPIEDYGILQQGKGSYVFVPVKNNLIDVAQIDCALLCQDTLDPFTKKFITGDEQGAITRLYSAGVFNYFSGFSEFNRIQDHWRTTGPQGQIEIDSLASVMHAGEQEIVLINVKKAPDRISKTYLYNLNRLGASKFDCAFSIMNVYVYDDYAICWLADNLDDLDAICPAETLLVKLYEKPLRDSGLSKEKESDRN